ncbi:mitochondrial carrier domain-containing protein [Triangularia setosa]|uniref:Mitochondrial inner membrane protease subunit n=1 Tax=Triangularia setosa TaxID=2587417 RepID=A0AAN6WGS8_9PEZI|nr:mitochondrial carrier domain-containing protein [Podospora setosa]
MSLSNCRFYEEKYPEIDSFVMVNVKQIADMGAYVKLLEYDNIDGMILLSELSRRRIRSIQKLIRVGRNEVVVVLRVDKEKGYIDLSKRRVSPEDIIRCEERYNKSKIVHSIMRHVAEKTETPIETLYETIGWPLNKKYGHSLDAFKVSITNPDVWNDIQFPSTPVADELKSYIGKRLTPQPTKVRADVEVTCFGYEGIDAIKTALRTAEARNTAETQVKCRLVSPPLYVLTNTCLDKSAGIARLEEAIVDIRTSIEAAGGHLVVKMEPKAVTESDDAELQALMEKRERENAEVSGDESVSESDDNIPETMASAASSTWRRRSSSMKFMRQFGHYLIRYATWLPPFIWFNSYVAEVTLINGPSMYPFFNAGYNERLGRDWCLVWKMGAREGLRRGEVVTFRSPTDPDKVVVKRVVGIEGDRIIPKPVGTWGKDGPVRKMLYPVGMVVPEGHVWVEGDNADKSRDSNYYGPVSAGLVTGRVVYCMLAGGIGGTSGDMLMHSLDTVKTRQQGDPHIPPKYTSLGSSYYKIWRQEGIRRGLYGGWLPALFGSFPGTVLFFGSYEWSKRQMLDYGVQPHLTYLTAGFFGDFVASFVYVPSEVLKTRLQLQGRYNNPHFTSGYNYKGTTDALRTIVRNEGASALFYGYGATLWRDLPYSALQFMFYEQGQAWARKWKDSRDIGWQLELLTGAAAGGLAGTITCPLDVVKTRLQTQVVEVPGQSSITAAKPAAAKEGQHAIPATEAASQKLQKRLISTSSPSTHTPKPGAVTLNTSSVMTGLRIIYKSEGIGGWFRGVGPRAVWTSIQSGCMLFLYQNVLRQLETYMPMERREVI